MNPLDPIAVPLDGLHLIEASAGTGKTYTITTLFLRLIAERGILVSDILTVTFTEAAAEELNLKLRERLQEAERALASTNAPGTDPLFSALVERAGGHALDRIRRALMDFDTAAVSTIHGFCRRILSDHAFESGAAFDQELVKESRPLYDEIAHDYFASRTISASSLFLAFLESAKKGPGELVSLLERLVQSGDAPVIPEAVPEVDPAEVLGAVFCEGQALFQNSRVEAERILVEDPGLDHRSYAKRHVARWLDCAGRFFSSSQPVWPSDEYELNRFTTHAVASKTKAGFTPPAHPLFDVCARIIDSKALFETHWLGLKQDFLDYAKKEAERRKAKSNICFFDDLLRHVDNALAGVEGEVLTRSVRGRFGALLIDEFQDTDARQYRIFKRLFGASSHPFFLIGDPKQSIYAFRGADIFAYLRATEDAGKNAYTLERNWRSDPSLIDAVNTLFSSSPEPFLIDQIEFHPVLPAPGARNRFEPSREAAPFEIRFVPRASGKTDKRSARLTKTWADAHLPDLVAADIAFELNRRDILQRKTTPSDIAVLVRTNAEARGVQAALGRAGILGVLWGEASVLDSLEAEELACVLSAVVSPKQSGRLKAALSTRLFGLTADEIASLEHDGQTLEAWTGVFDDWQRAWRRKGILQTIFAILRTPVKGAPPAAGLASMKNGERAITNFRHLAELLQNRADETGLGATGLLDWFQRERLGERRTSVEDAELRLESDGDAVRIITIHKAKGLQFNIVFAPYLWEGQSRGLRQKEVLFHDPNQGGNLILDIGSADIDAHRALARQEQAAENARLLYVALTRAKHRCIVVWGAISEMPTSPLTSLLHPARAEAAVATMTDDEILSDLNALAARARGAIRIDAFPTAAPVEAAGAHPELLLTCREWTGVPKAFEGTSSFSSITAASVGLGDDDVGPGFIPGRKDAAHIHRSGINPDPTDDTGILRPLDPSSTGLVPLAEFERGPRAGSCLHAIFEKLDTADPDDASLSALVKDTLAEFGFDAERWTKPIVSAVQDTLRLPLDPKDPSSRLSAVPLHKRLVELEFLFPLPNHERAVPVSSRHLADALLRDASGFSLEYIEAVRGLGFEPLLGFMRGFIDLVFEHKDRFFIVDYKSNFLGSRSSDYTHENLERAMATHHYFLQYLIYSVALNRYLKTRMPGYDFDRCFGGVYYLFIRGIRRDARSGIFFHRPNKAVIEALSDCLQGGDR